MIMFINKKCRPVAECNLDELGISSEDVLAWAKKIPLEQLIAFVRIDECLGKFPLPFKNNTNNALRRTVLHRALLGHGFIKGINRRTVVLSELYYDLTGERIGTKQVNREYQSATGAKEINRVYETSVFSFTDAQIHEMDRLLQFWVSNLDEHAAVVLKAHYSCVNNEMVSKLYGINPDCFSSIYEGILSSLKRMGIAREMERILFA